MFSFIYIFFLYVHQLLSQFQSDFENYFYLKGYTIHYCGGVNVTKLGYVEGIPWALRKYFNFNDLIVYIY